MNRLTRETIIFIAQGAYAGRFPVAPGTAGTLVGVPLSLAAGRFSPAAYLAFCGLVFLIGTWAAGRAEDLFGKKDHSSIVIDEVAGFLLALFLIPPGWGWVTAGFVLFRLFDIVKPFPLRRLQAVHGGLGVMLDDIGAGIYTNIVLQVVSGVLDI